MERERCRVAERVKQEAHGPLCSPELKVFLFLYTIHLEGVSNFVFH